MGRGFRLANKHAPMWLEAVGRGRIWRRHPPMRCLAATSAFVRGVLPLTPTSRVSCPPFRPLPLYCLSVCLYGWMDGCTCLCLALLPRVLVHGCGRYFACGTGSVGHRVPRYSSHSKGNNDRCGPPLRQKRPQNSLLQFPEITRFLPQANIHLLSCSLKILLYCSVCLFSL